MANWCENILILKCNNSTQIQRAVKAYNENRLLWEFFPEPNTVDVDEASDDWLEQNWGSGSDAGKDVGRGDDSEKSIEASETSTLVSFNFLTRWSPPVKAMRAFEEAGFSVELYYYEGEMAFCGLYTSDSGDKRYKIPETAAKVRKTIPDAINDAFAITEIMEAVKKETSGVFLGFDVLLLPKDPADALPDENDDIPSISRPYKVIGRPSKKDRDSPDKLRKLIDAAVARALREMNENTKAKSGVAEGSLEPFFMK